MCLYPSDEAQYSLCVRLMSRPSRGTGCVILIPRISRRADTGGSSSAARWVRGAHVLNGGHALSASIMMTNLGDCLSRVSDAGFAIIEIGSAVHVFEKARSSSRQSCYSNATATSSNSAPDLDAAHPSTRLGSANPIRRDLRNRARVRLALCATDEVACSCFHLHRA
jgi:hypothetical protein